MTRDYLDTKGRGGIPFFSGTYVVRDNFVQHGWRDSTELAPLGHGLCLDLGAGNGRDRQAIGARGWRWIGMDPGRSPELSLVGSAYGLPFRAHSLNFVFCNQVLEHLADPAQALSEAFRVLRPGGYLTGSASFLEPWHESCYGFSHWGIEQILQASGFEVTEIRPGASIFVTLAHHLLPGRTLGARAGGLVGRFVMGVVKWVGGAYTFLRFGRHSMEWSQYQSFLEKAPLRFAGHIQFAARKPGQ